MSQKTIDSFFKNPSGKSTNYEIKRYFYLIWDNKLRPSVQAYWCDTKPDKVNFIEQVQCNYIKKGYYFYICGYFQDNDDKIYHTQSEKVYKNIPYLKSHLQKCIRKKDDIRGIPTCYHLLKLDINELLRRLPIIMLEDTVLHESFSTIIWIMIALTTKKFKMKPYVYEWILGVIYTLCIIDENDNEVLQSVIQQEKDTVSSQLDKYSELQQSDCSLLYSIHLRIAYGGTENDLKMLQSYAALWENRFRNKTKKVNNIVIRPILLSSIKELSINDWDLSAIDYHCNSKFLEYISKKYDEIEEEELKKIIWNHSSGVNVRNTSPVIYNDKLWHEMKDYVIKTQKYLLMASY